MREFGARLTRNIGTQNGKETRMGKFIALMTTAVVGAVLMTAGVAVAVGDGSYNNQFAATYPAAAASRINSCSLCHTSAPTRNAYGTAWVGAGRNFTAINGADSDGDGFSNLDEITALTFPGDAADKPVPADTTAPTVNSFLLPVESTSLTVTILGLVASDNVGVTGYLLTQDAAVPAPGAPGWSAAKPTTYTFGAIGNYTLFAWAKDAANNVSSSLSATVLVTDTAPPPPPPPTSAMLLLSDFSGATSAGDPDWDRAKGRFGGVRQTLTNLAAGRNVSLGDDGLVGLSPFGGGRIETKVRLSKPVLRTKADILFDYVDARNYRFVRLDRATGRLVVGQVGTVGGESASALKVKAPRLFRRFGVWHHLRVDIDPVGGTVMVYVDGASLPTLTRTYAETGVGRIGVAATGAPRTVAFDNFTVWDTTVLP